jgi:hypothetical protein
MHFGPKSDEVTADLRRLHYEELHELHRSRNIIPVIESKLMRWA